MSSSCASQQGGKHSARSSRVPGDMKLTLLQKDAIQVLRLLALHVTMIIGALHIIVYT